MKHVWSFLIGAFGSHFHSHLTERSIWESHATFSHIGSVRPLTQLCGSSFLRVLIPAVEHLYILETGFSQLHWQDDIEIIQWLELLHPFTTAKDLYISSKFTPRIASALKEVLPSLQNFFFGGFSPIWKCPGNHRAVCCCATACRSPHCRFQLGKKVARRSICVVSTLPAFLFARRSTPDI